MARIRTIKPEFWKNEALSELPEAVHMLAAALLNYADDQGYFNANPRLIQAECFPLRELSVPTTVGLRELSRIGYVQIGKGEDGRDYGRIVSFSAHQVINKPTKPKISNLSIDWLYYSSTTVVIPEDYLPELGRELGTGNEEHGTELRPDGRLSSADDAKAEVQIAFDAYNDAADAAGWPKAQALTPKRKAGLRGRLKDAGGIDGWLAALDKAKASPHCCGQNSRGWTADLDFLTQQSSFTKLMEGSYDDRKPALNQQPAQGGNARGRSAHQVMFDAFQSVAAEKSGRASRGDFGD